MRSPGRQCVTVQCLTLTVQPAVPGHLQHLPAARTPTPVVASLPALALAWSALIGPFGLQMRLR